MPCGSRLTVDHAVTAGTFSLDGETHAVENNVWVIGDDRECVVIDVPHEIDVVLRLIGERRVKAILLTHAHDDHARLAPALREWVDAPVLLHPDDAPLWELIHPGERWDFDLIDGLSIRVAGTAIEVLHTPGHAPGAVCFFVADLGCVFSGDTLLHGGLGATGRSFSDKAVLEASVRSRLLVLPSQTVVHTGHGADTTVAAELARLDRPAGFSPVPSLLKRLPGEEVVP